MHYYISSVLPIQQNRPEPGFHKGKFSLLKHFYIHIVAHYMPDCIPHSNFLPDPDRVSYFPLAYKSLKFLCFIDLQVDGIRRNTQINRANTKKYYRLCAGCRFFRQKNPDVSYISEIIQQYFDHDNGYPKVCIALWFLLVVLPAKAQFSEYHLQMFDYPSGIRPDAITSLGKDRQGMLWVLYRSKVQRFDGKEVQNFRPSPRVNSLLCDRKGCIWVCAEREVFLFSERTGTFEPVAIACDKEGLKVGPVAELPGGKIWMLTSEGFFEFDQAKQRFDAAPPLPQYETNLHADIFVVYGNALFFHNDDFIYCHNIKTGRTDSIAGRKIYGIFPVSEDSALISMRDDSPNGTVFN